MLAHGLRIEVLSDDGMVVPGQDVRVSITIGDRGRPVDGVVRCARRTLQVRRRVQSGPLEVGAVYRCDAATQIPANAQNHETLLEASAERGAL